MSRGAVPDTTEVGVVGAGYVGLTSAACLAHLGHQVRCVDTDAELIAQLQHTAPLWHEHEPGLAELVTEGRDSGRLTFHTATDLGLLARAQTVLICVPTPPQATGELDLTDLHHLLLDLRALLPTGTRLVVRSTVPPGTVRQWAPEMSEVSLAAHPEFLREGHAVADVLDPDRLVVGADDPETARAVLDLYTGLDVPTLVTDPTSAELIKTASNAFLAMKTSYAHMLGELAEHLGADYSQLRVGLGLDPRIGPAHLAPGPGWGGPCLGKDTRALAKTAAHTGVDASLLTATLRANEHHQHRIVEHVTHVLDRPLTHARIAVFGLTFKAGTADLRGSPALTITRDLVARGAHVGAYDPAVPQSLPACTEHLHIHTSAEQAAHDSDLILVLTDWPEFTTLHWHHIAARMRHPTVVDTRACLPGELLTRAGLRPRPYGEQNASESEAADQDDTTVVAVTPAVTGGHP